MKSKIAIIVILVILVSLIPLVVQIYENINDAKEEKKLKKQKDRLFSELLPLIKNPKFFDPEEKAYRFHYKLENGHDFFLSLAEIDDDERLVLTVKGSDGKVVAEFEDVTSNKSPYPITGVLLSSFFEKDKHEVIKKYLLFLDHGVEGLMKAK